MLPGSQNSDRIRVLTDLLAGQVAHLEQLKNEIGASAMDPSTSDSVEMTLLHVVSTLRHIRNGERPVNKLPPEILSRIFSFVPGPRRGCGEAAGLTRYFGPHAIAPLADLLPLLGVCGRWQSVVTSSSFLWATLDNRDSRALSISSRYRPTSGLLDAHIGEGSHPYIQHLPRADRIRRFWELNTSFLDLLRHEGHRVREFNADVLAMLLPDLVDFPGESLQTCQLGLLDNSAESLGAIRPLFRGCTPQLKSLTMGNFLFIPSNEFPSLTHLILDGATMTTHNATHFTFLNFVLFLSRCPNLEVLHLIALDVARLKSLPDGLVLAPLHLQRLRKFSNEEALWDRTEGHHLPYIGPRFRHAILAHLHFHPDCIIRLATIRPHELGRTFNSLLFDTPFTSVYLGASGEQTSEFYASEPNGIESECFSFMATTPPHQRGVRVDFQMPGVRYHRPRTVTTQSARACLQDGIRSAYGSHGRHVERNRLVSLTRLHERDGLRLSTRLRRLTRIME